MTDRTFDITLPSNSSMKYFPNNLIGNFKTKLPTMMNFQGKDVHVALTQIMYIKSWNTITHDQTIVLMTVQEFEIFDPDGNKLGTYLLESNVLNRQIVIEKGLYENTEELIKTINSHFVTDENDIKMPKLEINFATHIVTVIPGNDKSGKNIYPFFDWELCNILGLRDAYINKFFNGERDAEKQMKLPSYRQLQTAIRYKTLNVVMFKSSKITVKSKLRKRSNLDEKWNSLEGDGPKIEEQLANAVEVKTSTNKNKEDQSFYVIKGKQPLDLSSRFHALFVYCDLVKPSIVGDTYAKLLKTVEVPYDSKFRSQVVVQFERLDWIPLSKFEFDTIEIDIKDSTDQTVPFTFGPLIVTLKFKIE